MSGQIDGVEIACNIRERPERSIDQIWENNIKVKWQERLKLCIDVTISKKLAVKKSILKPINKVQNK